MFTFSPSVFFISLLALTALIWILHRTMRHAHKKQLRSLASQWGMQYAQADLFNLSSRVAAEFPIVGVADLVIRDMIYATQGDRHRYVFTAEYTLGVIERHRREVRAVTFCDPREAGGQCATPLILAPEELPLIEQYKQLSKSWQPHGESD
jgi:hypothetical protein